MNENALLKVAVNELIDNQDKSISFKLFISVFILLSVPSFFFHSFLLLLQQVLSTMPTPNVISTLKEKVGVTRTQHVKREKERAIKK